jgi:hypothetical protein
MRHATGFKSNARYELVRSQWIADLIPGGGITRIDWHRAIVPIRVDDFEYSMSDGKTAQTQ